MTVYLIIRDLESIDGPEVDVFDNDADAQEMASILRANGVPFAGPQEQVIMRPHVAREFLKVAREGI
jgi:hypothetical protein